eukprot:GDKH01005987.1.p1 GENE.GDKH01005987.1~~GDKH01005987.1.p1  ORF type:complete len:219 (-),score=24.86 GDKH01005987.1:101-757(-)
MAFLGKVGAKSIAFINHKPFHPGNRENLEKVWMAETKQKEDEKRQKEMIEQRKKEAQVEELRKAMRNRNAEHAAFVSEAPVHDFTTQAQMLAQRRREVEGESESRNFGLARSRYAEDQFNHGHESVWGSWFEKESGKWGYSCCRSTDKAAPCAKPSVESAEDSGDTKKRPAQSDAAPLKKRKVQKGGNKGGGSGTVEGVADFVFLLKEAESRQVPKLN